MPLFARVNITMLTIFDVLMMSLWWSGGVMNLKQALLELHRFLIYQKMRHEQVPFSMQQ